MRLRILELESRPFSHVGWSFWWSLKSRKQKLRQVLIDCLRGNNVSFVIIELSLYGQGIKFIANVRGEKIV